MDPGPLVQGPAQKLNNLPPKPPKEFKRTELTLSA